MNSILLQPVQEWTGTFAELVKYRNLKTSVEVMMSVRYHAQWDFCTMMR